jgi:hypothetical protein
MTSEAPRTISHAEARATLARVGTDSKRIDEILAGYPDPFDLTEAEPSLMEKYGISRGALEQRMGGSP